MSQKPDGGPAFPNEAMEVGRFSRQEVDGKDTTVLGVETIPAQCGMSLRDWFAGTMSEDDRLVKCIRAMDDHALELFALHPGCEREEHITEVTFTNWMELGSEVAKVVRRLELEASAIARVRWMQADAMLEHRNQVQPCQTES